MKKRTVALLFLAIVAVLAGGSIAALRTRWAADRICAMAGRRVERVLGLPVAVAACRIDPIGLAVEVERVRVGPAAAPLFEADAGTKAIAIYSEPGGRMEAELADWVREHRSRLPIVAFMAGRFMDEMPGMRFGHAGTIVEGKADTTADKIERMRAAGIAVAERIEEIPALITQRLAAVGA